MILGKGKQEMRGQASMYNLHNQLMDWATIAPEHISIVEAETGRSMTYSHCLSAVQKMRQFLGAQPRNLILTLSGGIADAVLWLSALTGGHMLVPWLPTPQRKNAQERSVCTSQTCCLWNRRKRRRGFLARLVPRL